MVEFLFPCRCNGAGDAGPDGNLSRGPASGRQHAQGPARSDGGHAAVVAGGRAVWNLRAPRSVQRGVWRPCGSNRTDHLDAASAVIIFLGAAWNAELAERRKEEQIHA